MSLSFIFKWISNLKLKRINSIRFFCVVNFRRILSPEWRCVSYPIGVQLILLSIYCPNEISDFKNQQVLPTSFCFKMSPKGRCVSYPIGVQLFLLYFLFLVWKATKNFQNMIEGEAFLNAGLDGWDGLYSEIVTPFFNLKMLTFSWNFKSIGWLYDYDLKNTKFYSKFLPYEMRE